MAGMESYPRYPQEHQNVLERSLHDRYPSGGVLRLQQIGPHAQVPSKSYDEPPLHDDDTDDQLLLPRQSFDDFPFDDEEGKINMELHDEECGPEIT